MKIIYPTDKGIAVITPATGKNPVVIANKNVPAGVPYKLVDDADMPDRGTCETWTADFMDPDGYGADYGIGSEWDVVGYDTAGNPRVMHKNVGGRLDPLQVKLISTEDARRLRAVVAKGGHDLRVKAETS